MYCDKAEPICDARPRPHRYLEAEGLSGGWYSFPGIRHMQKAAVWFVLTICGAAASGADDAPFDYFRNSWNVVGLKDYADGTRVTPDNSIHLAGKNVLHFRFRRDLVPLSRRQTKTALEGWLPVMRFSAATARSATISSSGPRPCRPSKIGSGPSIGPPRAKTF